MASLGGEGRADAQMLAERVSRVVMDLKAVHAAEMARKQVGDEADNSCMAPGRVCAYARTHAHTHA
jgi:hypothetical protein